MTAVHTVAGSGQSWQGEATGAGGGGGGGGGGGEGGGGGGGGEVKGLERWGGEGQVKREWGRTEVSGRTGVSGCGRDKSVDQGVWRTRMVGARVSGWGRMWYMHMTQTVSIHTLVL